MDNEWILGIDGGGSKTTALLADKNGSILGRGTAGGSNFQAHTPQEVCTVLDGAVSAAFLSAGLPRSTVAALCLGLGGADRPADLQKAEDLLSGMGLARRLLVMNDGWLLLWSGRMQGVGVGLVSGTGSIAFGRDPQGKTARSGGWGWRLGDEGSGYAVALAALNAVTRAVDGRGPSTSLQNVLLHHLGLGDASQLIPYIYQRQPPVGEIASLAPLVLSEAQNGDAAALAILQQAGRELAAMLVAVARRLDLPSPLPCALGGGWIVHAPFLVQLLVDEVGKTGLQLSPLEIVEEPACGAVRLARQELDETQFAP